MKKLTLTLLTFLISCTSFENTVFNNTNKNQILNTSNSEQFDKDFKVSNTRNELQLNSSIATSPKGSVITWISYKKNTAYFNIYAQRLDTNFKPIGNEIKVNIREIDLSEERFTLYYSNFINSSPKVAMDKDGNFVIAFDFAEFKKNAKLHLKRYTANGLPIGTEFEQNLTTSYYTSYIKLFSLDDNGNIFIIDNNGFQYIDKNNNTIQKEFTLEKGFEVSSVVSNEKGDLVFIFSKFDSESKIYNFYFQRHSKLGEKIGEIVKINNVKYKYKSEIRASINNKGDLAFVYYRPDEKIYPLYYIYAQKYTLDNKENGNEIQIASVDNSPNIKTILTNNDEIIVTWGEKELTEEKKNLSIKIIDKNGLEKESEFKANYLSKGRTVNQDISLFDNNFLITWSNWNEIKNDFSIYARKYNLSEKIKKDDPNLIVKEKIDCSNSSSEVNIINKQEEYKGDLKITVLVNNEQIEINNKTTLQELYKKYPNFLGHDSSINALLDKNHVHTDGMTIRPNNLYCLDYINEKLGFYYIKGNFDFYYPVINYKKINLDNIQDLLLRYINDKNKRALPGYADFIYGNEDIKSIEFEDLDSLANFWLFLDLKLNYSYIFKDLYLKANYQAL
ncbi:MAG: hypothetical protein AABZ74_00440 [Cyanobacteriota bacterium]